MTSFAHQRICVTGGTGFLGRVVSAKLRELGVRDVFIPRRCEFDLTQADAISRMFDAARPDVVIHLAAEVGGIGANQQHPGRFFYVNLMMGLNLIEEARKRGVDKFVQVGTVCAYPKFCETPFREEDLWSGYPEETNAPYGLAKRSLAVMLDAYRREYRFNGVYLIPSNLYGPEDNFDPHASHVVAALIRKFCEAVESGAQEVACWGTGTASREFLYVDDAAEAVVKAAQVHDDPRPINLGSGCEVTIAQLAKTIARHCGFDGRIVWDHSRPDGQPRRLLDTSRAEKLLGWRAKVDLDEGLRRTVDWWRAAQSSCSPAPVGAH